MGEADHQVVAEELLDLGERGLGSPDRESGGEPLLDEGVEGEALEQRVEAVVLRVLEVGLDRDRDRRRLRQVAEGVVERRLGGRASAAGRRGGYAGRGCDGDEAAADHGDGSRSISSIR